MSCYFPGNVRELENCVRRAAALSNEDVISDGDFACNADSCLSGVMSGDFLPRRASSPEIVGRPLAVKPAAPTATRRTPFDGRSGGPERERLIGAMERAGWVQAKAARLLNLTPRQIAYALVKHHIPIKKF
jgi:Nif-specific regulatory protein